MEEPPRWSSILHRIVPQDAADLDDVTRAYDARSRAVGRDLFPEITPVLHAENALRRPDMDCVGLRVAAPLPDASDQAMRLVSVASEQDVEVIVLAMTDVTGLERFGFRVERISGDEPGTRDLCEQQVRHFWAIDLVL